MLIVSALFLPASLTVGASGAIFGLLGGAWADLIQNWSHTVNPCCQMIGLRFTTALNVGMGLMPFLDNFCHLGGMVSGFFGSLADNKDELDSGYDESDLAATLPKDLFHLDWDTNEERNVIPNIFSTSMDDDECIFNGGIWLLYMERLRGNSYNFRTFLGFQ